MIETPADAFGVLANDDRVAILEAIAEATRPGYGEEAVRFSEVHDEAIETTSYRYAKSISAQ